MCGVVGISGVPEASLNSFQALLLLQHRGQDAAGIITDDSKSGRFRLRKAMGQVDQAIDSKSLNELTGERALAHTRYSTIGDVKIDDVQPLALTTHISLAGVHNGNISNAVKLRDRLRSRGRLLMTDNDLELLLHLIADRLHEKDSFLELCEAVTVAMEQAEGGYACVMLWGGRGIFAFKDAHGLRPLCVGKKDNSYAFASETSALRFLGYGQLRELEAGELVWIDENNKLHSKRLKEAAKKSCFFEWVYFAGAESRIDNIGVYSARIDLGTRLAKKIKALKNIPLIDVVAPVPDTSRPAAAAIAEELSLPYREVLIRNRYVQRSFILNGQEKRKQAVELKFSVVEEQVRGKNILLVDDSIVRGTTSRRLVALLKKYGAKNIVFASTCPPIVGSCHYGVDFPNKHELIAHGRSIEAVKNELGCEGLIYIDIEDLNQSLGKDDLCTACLGGEYPYAIDS